MSEFVYTDLDGNTLEAAESAHPRFAAVITCTDPEADAGFASVGLTADGARDLAAKLTEWAGEDEPPAPTFKVGDRVEVLPRRGGEFAGLPARVVGTYFKYERLFVRIARESDGEEGSFLPDNLQHIAEPPTPDYAALAAEFKPGDLAIVGDNPGTGPAPGSGYVAASYAGMPVVVEGPGFDAALVSVRHGDKLPQRIHVAHLTKAKAVPA